MIIQSYADTVTGRNINDTNLLLDQGLNGKWQCLQDFGFKNDVFVIRVRYANGWSTEGRIVIDSPRPHLKLKLRTGFSDITHGRTTYLSIFIQSQGVHSTGKQSFNTCAFASKLPTLYSGLKP